MVHRSELYLPRRFFLGGTFGLAGAAIIGCGGRQAPLAHLHGKDWVHGAYELYAGEYAGVQKRTCLLYTSRCV